MTKRIKLTKGLNINLVGAAETEKRHIDNGKFYALRPSSFIGVTPSLTVKIGDKVKAGSALFANKHYSDVTFSSPVSGVVKDIVRGDRRKILAVVVEADDAQEYVDFGKKDVTAMTGDDVIKSLLEAGLFGYINQLPYAISTNPEAKPKSIFVSAFRDMPLAADFDYELKGQEEYFQAGMTALSKIAKTYLGISAKQKSDALLNIQNVETTIFDGPCPAGNVGVHVNHLDPVNKGEVVWTVEPTTVLFFGRLFLKGIVDLHRTVAVAGSEIAAPAYSDVLVGTPLSLLLEGNISNGRNRIIEGNPLTGTPVTMDAYLGGHTSEVTVIPEGDDNDEFLGWLMPRFSQLSVNRSYFSWLMGKKAYKLDARVKGGERHMIMSGEYDKVLPMDILPEYLIKAIITGDIDKMEQLGIYEVSPEDFALAEFVCSSKLELQKIVREGIDLMLKA
jgi:Na+-transporting NADH:ubiquinone oxidoreductase subunit A